MTKHVRKIVEIGESLGLLFAGLEHGRHAKILFRAPDGRVIKFFASRSTGSVEPRLLKNAKAQLRHLMNGIP